MFFFHNSLLNIVVSASARTDLVMLLQLLLTLKTCGMLVAIQSQKRSVSFDQWYHLQPSWTDLLQFHVRCNSIGETCRFFWLSFHEHFIYVGVFFGDFFVSFVDKERSIDDKKTGLMSWITCKWPFQFSSLSTDINVLTNFNNVSKYHTIPDAAADLSVNSL